MKLTKGILDETSKARAAAERSAAAAEESASATFQSLHLMREQLEEHAGLGRSIVRTTIDSATNAIDHWKSLKIRELNISRFPSTADLVPATASSAVEHARGSISSDAAVKLSSAFRSC